MTKHIFGVTPRSCCTTLATSRGDSACTYYTELLELPSDQTLHHISGTINVADNCTRGKEIHELTPESRCISGTQFFMLPEEEWSSSKEGLRVNDSELEVGVSVLTTSIAPSVIVVEWEKYSTWKSLIRLYAPPGWQIKISTADDLKEGSLASCKIAQIKSFGEGYKDPQATQALSKSPLLPMRPVLTEGGRLYKALIPFEANHQVLVSPKHPLYRLLVQDLHKKHFHVRREHVLALVHQQFWIPRGKWFIRTIVNDCLHCKRRRAKPEIPVMASLPGAIDLHWVSFRSQTPAWTTSVRWMLREEESWKKDGDVCLRVWPPVRFT